MELSVNTSGGAVSVVAVEEPQVDEREVEKTVFWRGLGRWTMHGIALVVAVTIFLLAGGKILQVADLGRAGDPVLLFKSGLGAGVGIAALIALLLIVVTALSSFLMHPTSRAGGIYCALLGLLALAHTSGPLEVDLRAAQLANSAAIFQLLCGEVLLWAAVVASGQAVGQLIWTQWLRNEGWIGAAVEGPLASRVVKSLADDPAPPSASAIGPGLMLKSTRLPPLIQTLGAWLVAVAAGLALMLAFARTQSRGQVEFACFISFLLSSALAYSLFPRASTWAFALAAPLAGAIGYALTPHWTPIWNFPGHVSCPLGRPLPIDYASAGAAGALLAYHMMLRWHAIEVIQLTDESD